MVDSFVVGPGIDRQVVASLEHGLKLGDGLLGFHVTKPKRPGAVHEKFHDGFGCARHRLVAGEKNQAQFTFNDPSGACATCGGIGTAMRVHPALLVPDPSRSLNEGALVGAAMSNGRDSWGGRILHSLAARYGFSLDTPFKELEERHVNVLLHGTKGEAFEVLLPPGAKLGHQHAGKKIKFNGIVAQLEHQYRQYRKQGTSNAGMDEYLKRVMVEYDCPECGGARLKRTRRLVTVAGRNLFEIGQVHLAELLRFLRSIEPTERQRPIAETIVREVRTRLDLLIAIGLDYLNLNRRSSTLSGGESQRIRLSSQIGSGLMGMLYVLDEPSIGLHPKDNVKMIETLRRLRDLGNTVIGVEHDADTIRAADHVVEIGPGPGIHGGSANPPAPADSSPGSFDPLALHRGTAGPGARRLDPPNEWRRACVDREPGKPPPQDRARSPRPARSRSQLASTPALASLSSRRRDRLGRAHRHQPLVDPPQAGGGGTAASGQLRQFRQRQARVGHRQEPLRLLDPGHELVAMVAELDPDTQSPQGIQLPVKGPQAEPHRRHQLVPRPRRSRQEPHEPMEPRGTYLRDHRPLVPTRRLDRCHAPGPP